MKAKWCLAALVTVSLSLQAAPAPKWQRPNAWAQIADNQTEQKVMSILGRPLIEYELGSTLFYYYQSPPQVAAGQPRTKSASKAYVDFVKRKLVRPDKGVVSFVKAWTIKTVDSEGRTILKIDHDRRAKGWLVRSWTLPDWKPIAAQTPDTALPVPFVTPQENPDPNAPAWQNPRIWRLLKKGMSPAQVERIFGLPPVDERLPDSYRQWVYSDIFEHGVIYFSVKKDKPEYEVSHWQEPYWPDVFAPKEEPSDPKKQKK